MKKLGSAFLACVLLASISLSALASGEVTKYDYFASRDAYEALYRDAYKPLYEEYHENYRRLYSEAEKGSELAAFLAELKAEYREFFGYREEAGGTEGMSRYDVPAARGLMYASRYAEDWASAVYYCDEVLVPLIQERIEFLGDMIDRMHSFDGRGPEEPDGPDNPPEEPDEPLVDILERMNACIRDVVNSWGTFRSVDSEAPDQDKTGQINRLLEDAFGEEFLSRYGWAIHYVGGAYVIYLAETDLAGYSAGDWIDAVKFGSASGRYFSGQAQIGSKSKANLFGETVVYNVIEHSAQMKGQQVIR